MCCAAHVHALTPHQHPLHPLRACVCARACRCIGVRECARVCLCVVNVVKNRCHAPPCEQTGVGMPGEARRGMASIHVVGGGGGGAAGGGGQEVGGMGGVGGGGRGEMEGEEPLQTAGMLTEELSSCEDVDTQQLVQGDEAEGEGEAEAEEEEEEEAGNEANAKAGAEADTESVDVEEEAEVEAEADIAAGEGDNERRRI